ncbi:MAG TPA: restriction endonuclease [Flavisolibacter sp.]|jgi:restriction system protein|nr:restriction endonuclease [Flavisolibacter sp.]
MPIPDFQSIMLPFLKQIGDGEVHTTAGMRESLSRHFNLTEEELSQYLPSGTQKVFYNRIHWAKAHLKMAGLLEDIKKRHFRITPAGKELLKTAPATINLQLLKAFPGYLEKTGRTKEEKALPEGGPQQTAVVSTPEELLETGYTAIRKALAEELLARVKACSPAFFEKLVVELLVKMGYGGSFKEAGQSIGRSGDEGIDGIIKEDRLGLDVIYIQAKRWEGVVGRPELHRFVGALAGQGAKKGVFITTSWFTLEAKTYQPKNETKIVLIDGEQLARLMIDFDLGVTTQQTYLVKRADSDYFEGD